MKNFTPKFNQLKTMFYILIAGIVITFTACDQTKKVDDTSSNTNTLDTVSVQKFNHWNTNWETHWKTDSIVYFTMPLSDLQNTLEEVGVDSARFYLGFSEAQNRAHLTLVGVDANGNSMIGGGNHIYDVSMPCPPGCGGGKTQKK